MSKEEFIKQIAKLIVKYAPIYNIAVCSPVIAQAVLESGYGSSELARNAHNYFGLKYRKSRCPSATGIYKKVGSEQNPDGSYISEEMQWCRFPDMESGVKGYFEFTNVPNYANLKGVTDPETYLKNIRADGYATSLNYVDNLMAVIKTWNLTEYDNKEVDTMSNSPLVVYTKLSPNNSGARKHAIDRISPHCVVGQCSVETLGNIFAPTSRQASCNYGIGPDGRVGMYVEEKNRSWCTSSSANDNRAVTIECASDTKAPYAFKDTVYNRLIDLCVDICQRNGKKKLLWISNKAKALAYEPKSDEMLLTVHRWFANKSCPGDWLMARMDDLASKVTARLGGTSTGGGTETKKSVYRVRKTWSDSKTQVGAYKVLANAKKAADEHPGYAVFDESGVKIYPISEQAVTPAKKSYTVMIDANVLNVRKGPGTNYGINTTVRKGEIYTIIEESADGKWGKLKSGAGWISLAYTRKK